MGMFDNVRCNLPLPWPEAAEFGSEWQTKTMPVPHLEQFEIREDGTLWHEEYDVEDQSDPSAEGFDRFLGSMVRVNKRWVKVEFEGELEIYHLIDPPNSPKVWYEIRFWFRGGVVRDKICRKTVNDCVCE